MGRAPIRLLQSGEKLDLTGKLQNGYYQVRTGKDELGWAWARNISTNATEISDFASKRFQLATATNLRRGPSTRESAIRLLQADESLRLADAAPRAGYYHVKTADGEDGWVWARAGIIAQAPRVSEQTAAAAPAAPMVQQAPIAKAAPPAPVAPKVEQAPAVVEAPKPAVRETEEARAVAEGPKVEPEKMVAEAPKQAAPKVEEPKAVVEQPKPLPPKAEEAPVVEAPKPVAPKAEEPAVVAAAPKEIPPAPVAEAAPERPVERGDMSGGLKVGDTLDKSTAHLAKGMLPDEILGHYERGEYTNPIVDYPLGSPMWDPAFIEATKQNSRTLAINDKGTIIDPATGQQPAYLYGIPFPNVDANDPQAAVKIIWNQYLAVWYNGSAHTKTKMMMMNSKGVERELGAEGYFKFYDGEAPKYRGDNPMDLQAQFLGLALTPSDMQGTASLSWRYRDPNKHDSQWAYVPALRRVRSISPANRSDGYLGSDISPDDGYFFDGKPQDFEWKLVGKRDALRIVDPQTVNHKIRPRPVPTGGFEVLTHTTDDFYGFQTAGWSGLPWALPSAGLARRPMWIIEAVPRDKYYLYGHLVMWIDAETWDGSYHQKFNWNGDHILTYQVIARVNQPVGPKPDDETIQAATMAWAVAENFKMRRATMAGARLDAKSPYDRRVPIDTALFDAGQLMRWGK
ncbi:MAG TPA: DUF1329 domain-containing protein [Candidatus Binatia bacterium]|nr:DUF1329 domain-containing protein [Candidatus Binatia bacterium]